jgi:hypothetical protein
MRLYMEMHRDVDKRRYVVVHLGSRAPYFICSLGLPIRVDTGFGRRHG